MLQLSVWELTPHSDREEGLAAWREFIVSGTLSGEYAIQRKDGTVLNTEFRAVANIVPGLHLSVMRDISERKEREEALRATNERLRTIIEASPAALVVLTLEGKITLWNPAAEEIFGWKAEEVVGHSYPLAESPELATEFREKLRRAATGESITELEARRQRKDGKLIDVSMNVASVYGRSGEVTGVLGLITENAGEIALIVSDVAMPVMGGAELHARLIERDPTIKMVLMTGYPLEEKDKELLHQGVVAWVQKPFNVNELAVLIEDALGEGRA